MNDFICGRGDINFFALGLASQLDFDFTGGKRLLADGNTDGNAQQIGVVELYAGSYIRPVVKEDLDALFSQLFISLFGGFGDFRTYSAGVMITSQGAIVMGRIGPLSSWLISMAEAKMRFIPMP